MKTRETGWVPKSDLPAWERERQLRLGAVPIDFNENPPDWGGIAGVLEGRRSLLGYLWASEVPGSRAPEHLCMTMVQAWGNRGYDVTGAESYLNDAFTALETSDFGELERLTGRILAALRTAPIDEKHFYWDYETPESWDNVVALMPSGAKPDQAFEITENTSSRIRSGWIGQNAGGAYGTALEGFTGEALNTAYGDSLNGFVIEPDTLNDDLTFQIAFLQAALTKGTLTDEIVGDWWLKIIPFGWSAEYFALENLRRGIYPPESGRFGNPFSEWIGAQMRTMVCGFCAPGQPLLAAQIAYMDSSVSHTSNGIYGGIHAAVLTALAFIESDPRRILEISRDYLPEGTEFTAIFDAAMAAAKAGPDHLSAWTAMDDRLKSYNWIHVYPNMVANVLSLWFGGGDFTRSFRILADCGMDVDCNAGVVGSVLGVIGEVPAKWADPIGVDIHTYIPGMEHIPLDELTDWTVRAAKKLNGGKGI